MDSLALGQFVLPVMEKLPAKLPQLRSAVLCTEDGFNVCSIGVTEDQLGKMAALASSLLTMGEATVHNLMSGTTPKSLEVLTLQAGPWTTVGVRVGSASRPLVLMVSATDTPLGVLHLSARQVAEEVRQKLTGTSARPAAPQAVSN